jgi:hypothetical protein
MKQSDFDKAMLVEFAVREVAGGSLEEMQAVIFCIRNRVRKGWHDGKWVENIEQAFNYAAHERPFFPELLNCDQRNYQRLLNGVDDIYYGQKATGVGLDGKARDQDAQGSDMEAAIGTATYWQFLKRPVRAWFADNVVADKANHPMRTQMGMMIFYR